MLRKAGRLKQTYTTVVATKWQLTSNIEKDSAYAWAKNPQSVGRLRAASAELQKHLADFDREWPATPLQSMQKQHDAPYLHTELARFLRLQKYVTEITRLRDQILDKHCR